MVGSDSKNIYIGRYHQFIIEITPGENKIKPKL